MPSEQQQGGEGGRVIPAARPRQGFKGHVTGAACSGFILRAVKPPHTVVANQMSLFQWPPTVTMEGGEERKDKEAGELLYFSGPPGRGRGD